MLNSSTLVGRLVKTPEIKKTQNEISFCPFTIAVESYGGKSEKRTNFIDCVAWREKAEFIAKYFQKGSPISLIGEITTRNYEDTGGTRHKVTEIVVKEVFFVPGNVKKEQPENVPIPDEPYIGDEVF